MIILADYGNIDNNNINLFIYFEKDNIKKTITY